VKIWSTVESRDVSDEDLQRIGKMEMPPEYIENFHPLSDGRHFWESLISFASIESSSNFVQKTVQTDPWQPPIVGSLSPIVTKWLLTGDIFCAGEAEAATLQKSLNQGGNCFLELG